MWGRVERGKKTEHREMQESASGCGININYSPAKVQERLDDKKLLTGHDVYTLFKLYIYFYATLLLFQCFVIFLCLL